MLVLGESEPMNERPSLTMRQVLLALCLLTLPLVALAQSRVIVEVKTPSGEAADGKVTLEPVDGGRSYSCTTTRGQCTLEGVPGGRYVATLTPKEGEPPAPRRVMIPPAGEVTVHIPTR
jgi:hypothetical protein